MSYPVNTVKGTNGIEFKLERLSACPACESTNIDVHTRTKDFVFGTGDYAVYKCGRCGIGFLNPRPIEKDAAVVNSVSTVLPSTGFMSMLRYFRLRRRIRVLSKYFQNKSDIVCCDVGCGDGYFAYVASQVPGVKQVDAIDFSLEAPPLLRHNDYASERLSYLSYQDFKSNTSKVYDVIFCRHMLEHVHDIRAWINGFYDKLDIGGVLILEVPRWDSVWFGIFGGNYSHLGAPQHVNQFTEQSLKWHLAKFKLVHMGQTHGMVLWPSISIAIGRKFGSPTSLLQYMLMPIEIIVDRLSGRYSVLLCVAQKEMLSAQ